MPTWSVPEHRRPLNFAVTILFQFYNFSRMTHCPYATLPNISQVLVGVEEEAEVVTFTLAKSTPGLYILDVEPIRARHVQAGAGDLPTLLKLTDLLGSIPTGTNPTASTAALCDSLLQTMPGYDRAMVYRFDENDGSGEVIHEKVRPEAEIRSSYLGLRFPAADIPPQAREMFKTLGARFIADTSARGVPVETLHERVSALDLSKSSLRAAASCHLRYLQNMGVKASLVVAIVVDGKMWGLYIFHGYSQTVHPTCKERIMAGMAATITASLISRHNREKAAVTTLSLSRLLGKIRSSYTRVEDFLLAEHKPLLEIVEADTVVLFKRSQVVGVYGNQDVALTLSECRDLIDKGGVPDHELDLHSLRGEGVVLFSVRSYVVAFLRGSVAKSVKWAGKPDDSQDNEEKMHPRASFEQYVQISAAKFPGWLPATVELLNMVHQSFSSLLYAEGLPADLQETFAHVSHELRTPFHGVMGSLEILEAGLGSMNAEEQLDIIRSARKCGDSMMGTLDEILSIAKDRNAGVCQTRFIASTPISLSMTAMAPFAVTESVDLVEGTGPAENMLEVIGDCARIKGVVQNLINNAIKFTPRGGKVRVSLSVFDSMQDVTRWWGKEADRFDARVWLGRPRIDTTIGVQSSHEVIWHVYCVEDSGIGVSPGDLPHLAAAYRQISQGATKLYAGTGLGLNICKRHVDAMFGALGIASTFSEEASRGGTLFAVVLPLTLAKLKMAVGGNPTKDVLTAAAAIPCCQNIGSRTAVFIVVDDHKVNLKLIENKIKRHMKNSGGNTEVLSASNGRSALDMYEATRSDTLKNAVLVGAFIDLHMPVLDGTECTRRIRRSEAERDWSRTTICGCTADLTERARDDFMDAGGDGILPKPWHPGQLESMCNTMVAKMLDAEQSRIGAEAQQGA